jgi:hypothetical protein
VPVAKILDLRFSAVEAMIALAQAALPVLPLAIDNATRRQKQDRNLTAKVDGVACRVSL